MSASLPMGHLESQRKTCDVREGARAEHPRPIRGITLESSFRLRRAGGSPFASHVLHFGFTVVGLHEVTQGETHQQGIEAREELCCYRRRPEGYGAPLTLPSSPEGTGGSPLTSRALQKGAAEWRGGASVSLFLLGLPIQPGGNIELISPTKPSSC